MRTQGNRTIFVGTTRGGKAMRVILFVPIILLPYVAFAATDCHVTEYQDHYVVVCEGDSKSGTIPVQQSTPTNVSALVKSDATVKANEKAKPEVTSKTDVPKIQHIRRQHRPSASDMEAAQELRRKLILERRQKEGSDNPVVPQTEPVIQDADI
jgi:hypothetical protein